MTFFSLVDEEGGSVSVMVQMFGRTIEPHGDTVIVEEWDKVVAHALMLLRCRLYSRGKIWP